MGQDEQEGGERRFQRKADSLRVDHRHHHVLRECTGRPLLEGHQAIEGKLHGSGIHCGAVIELVAGLDLELPDQVVRRHGPAFRQIPCHFGAALVTVGFVAHQTLIGRVGDGPVVVIEGYRRVERLWVGGLADDQSVLSRRCRSGLPGAQAHRAAQ